MPVHNRIKRLPPTIRAEINRQLDAGWTLDDIVAHLRGLEVSVSRSGLHRYSREYEAVSKRLRATRDAASTLARDLGATATDDVARLTLEMVQNLLYAAAGRAVATGAGSGDGASPKDLAAYARSALDLARTRRETVDAAAAADEVLLQTGSAEPVQALRVRFASGSRIVALPSSPRALRGRQGLVVIDEAALHDDLPAAPDPQRHRR